MRAIIIIFLLLGIIDDSRSQPGDAILLFGDYHGTHIKYVKHFDDTSSRIDEMNKLWGRRDLKIDSNGNFFLEFPVAWPATQIGQMRTTHGTWIKKNDTLILNSLHPYRDYINVKERKINSGHIRVRLRYTAEGKIYYPALDLSINDKNQKIIDTRSKKWVHYPAGIVNEIRVEQYSNLTTTKREWLYKPVKKNSNSFVITVADNIDGDNYVLENYRLLIVDSTLVQIDKVFFLKENCYRLKQN